MLTSSLTTAVSLWFVVSALPLSPPTDAAEGQVLRPAAQAGFEQLQSTFDARGTHGSVAVISGVQIDKNHAVVSWTHAERPGVQRLILRPPGGAVAVGRWFSAELPGTATPIHLDFANRLGAAIEEAFPATPWQTPDVQEPTLPTSPSPLPGPSSWMVALALLGTVGLVGSMAWW